MLCTARHTVAIEVKSRPRHDKLTGMAAFAATFKPTRTLLVGGDGIALETFLAKTVTHWLTPRSRNTNAEH